MQAELHAEARPVWPSGAPTSDPWTSYAEDYPRLVRPFSFIDQDAPLTHTQLPQKYSLAVFRETLRHYPAVPRLWKIVQQDAVLPYTTLTSDSLSAERHGDYVAPSGSVVILDFRALHMNRTFEIAI